MVKALQNEVVYPSHLDRKHETRDFQASLRCRTVSRTGHMLIYRPAVVLSCPAEHATNHHIPYDRIVGKLALIHAS